MVPGKRRKEKQERKEGSGWRTYIGKTILDSDLSICNILFNYRLVHASLFISTIIPFPQYLNCPYTIDFIVYARSSCTSTRVLEYHVRHRSPVLDTLCKEIVRTLRPYNTLHEVKHRPLF